MLAFTFSGYYVSFAVVLTLAFGANKELLSAPGCPRDGAAIWLKYEADERCYKVNSRGPCGKNMIFYPHPNPDRTEKLLVYGFCDCFDARMLSEDDIAHKKKFTTGCTKDLRTQLFVPERDRCYSAFDQGPCDDGKWLVLNATSYPVCAINSCASTYNKDNELSPKFIFSHSVDGPCYETMTKGYCPDSHILRVSDSHWLPTCSYISEKNEAFINKKCPGSQKGTILVSKCKTGSRRDFLTKCSSKFNPR